MFGSALLAIGNLGLYQLSLRVYAMWATGIGGLSAPEIKRRPHPLRYERLFFPMPSR
jgi:hypothetical protein